METLKMRVILNLKIATIKISEIMTTMDFQYSGIMHITR